MDPSSPQADGDRWWWLSTAAGLLASLAIAVVLTAVLAAPLSGAAPSDRSDLGGLPLPPAPGEETRPCFIVQDQWNEVLDWPQPTCPRPPAPAVAHDGDRRAR